MASTSQDNRIIHVPRRFVAEEWGGTETVILEISKRQKQAGWSPEIYTSLALSTRREEAIDGIPVHRFDYCYPFFGLSKSDRLAMDKKGGNLLSLPLFRALQSAGGVRLFHAHALNRLGGEVRTAARRNRKPYVVTRHGGVFDVPPGELEEMARPLRGKLEWGRLFGLLFGSRRVLDDADHVICVGYDEFESAKKRIPHARISYLPNGVDPDKFRTGDGATFRRKHRIADNAFVILNISRIDPQKNQLVLLEAFAKLQASDQRAHLVIIGPETRPEYALKLKSCIRENRLEKHVTMLAGLKHGDPDLVNAYHACDVFALPSVHEPFGIVVLEAWCSRKPVVASRIGGLKTLIREDETGLFFEPDAADAAQRLAARLELCLSQPQLCGRLAKHGHREATAHYAWPAIGKRLEEIYQAAENHASRLSFGPS